MHPFDVLRHQSGRTICLTNTIRCDSTLQGEKMGQRLESDHRTGSRVVSKHERRLCGRRWFVSERIVADAHSFRRTCRTNALQLLLELLSTYTKETASKARADACKWVCPSVRPTTEERRSTLVQMHYQQYQRSECFHHGSSSSPWTGENSWRRKYSHGKRNVSLRTILTPVFWSVVEHFRLRSFGRLFGFLFETNVVHRVIR